MTKRLKNKFGYGGNADQDLEPSRTFDDRKDIDKAFEPRLIKDPSDKKKKKRPVEWDNPDVQPQYSNPRKVLSPYSHQRDTLTPEVGGPELPRPQLGDEEQRRKKPIVLSKLASIVDFPHYSLPEDLFDFEHEKFSLKDYIKDDIIRRVYKFFEEQQIKSAHSFLMGLYIGGSTATQFYTKATDVDVKIIIDVDLFKQFNNISCSKDEILTDLIDKIRSSDVISSSLSGTERPVDFYFYDIEDLDLTNLSKYDSLYDILDNTWVKEPVYFNPEEFNPKIVLDRATSSVEGWANKLDLQLGKLRRQVRDFDILREYLSELSKEHRFTLQKKIEDKLLDIETEIKSLSSELGEIVDTRHNIFKQPFHEDPEQYLFSINWAPENVQFKLLQRWGYIKVLRELKRLVEDDSTITESEVPKIEEILKEGSSPVKVNIDMYDNGDFYSLLSVLITSGDIVLSRVIVKGERIIYEILIQKPEALNKLQEIVSNFMDIRIEGL